VDDPSEFTPVEDASVRGIVAAQNASADWLDALGAPPDTHKEKAQALAREAFQAVNNGVAPTDAQKQALLGLKSPAAVRHLTGMLTAYDWEFVEQARELRGYALSQILEETKNPDARVRLKALQMLGNVTEVGLFTERVEITRKDASTEELEAKLRARLQKYLTPGATTAPIDVEARA
jgi:hypothetical protein